MNIIHDAMDVMRMTLRDAVYGAAVGDAFGVPYEFKGRDSFECDPDEMVGGGSHGQPAGTFSDDTSMILATCDSLRRRRKVDVEDIRKRFGEWFYRGKYAVGGKVFDCGSTVATAIEEGRGCKGERSNGNGSLMRIVPLAFTDATDDDVRAVSAITHAHPTSTEACVCFVRIARAMGEGATIAEAVDFAISGGESEFAFLRDRLSCDRDSVGSGGYVLDTLGAAIWCMSGAGSYQEAIVSAVNLGRDTDTTACVAGALAGITFGYDGIPQHWLETLRGKDIIERCLF